MRDPLIAQARARRFWPLAWLGCAYAVYRRRLRDIFVLACAVLSVIIVVSTFLGDRLIQSNAIFAFLFIGLVVIRISAAGGWWLRNVAIEDQV